MLKDLLKSNRSYRSFDRSAKIGEDLLAEWIGCARLCPSSINLQMLKFRTVTDEDECARLYATTHWAGKIKDQKIPPTGHEPVAYIVVCADRSVVPNAGQFLKDVGIVSLAVMLAATEAGYGGCMIGSCETGAVTSALSLPENLVPELVLALGKPDETVELVDMKAGGDSSYFRRNGIHYVPKRTVEELTIKSPKASKK